MSTVTVTVTRSAGNDGAVVVMIDTDFEPNASDGGPGLRVLINDDPTYAGVAYESAGDVVREVGAVKAFTVDLADIPYMCQMVYDGTDTDGTVWNRCTVHDQLAMDGAYVCEGYEPPPYKGGH